MKRFSFLLLVSLLSTFHAFSQTHFITAGQTQGMIFTDVDPDYYLSNSLYYTFDLNHDSLDDCKITYQPYASYSNGFTRISLFQFSGNILQINVHPDSLYYSPDSLFAKKFRAGDTMRFKLNAEFHSTSYVQYEYCPDTPMPHFPPCSPARFTDTTLTPYDDDYYYLFKMIHDNDSLLGYIHMNHNSLLDYAIEDPTASYTTSHSLSSSNISITPNPFTSFINITSGKPFQYTISDYMGRVAMQGKSDKRIETETLAPGSYILSIKNEEMLTVKKIVKYNP